MTRNADLRARTEAMEARAFAFRDRMKLLHLLTDEFRASGMDGMVELFVMCEQVFRAQGVDMKAEADQLIRDCMARLEQRVSYAIIERQWDDPEFD